MRSRVPPAGRWFWPVILTQCHETDTKGAVTGQDDGTQEEPDG
jgi:hypothetical protein